MLYLIPSVVLASSSSSSSPGNVPVNEIKYFMSGIVLVYFGLFPKIPQDSGGSGGGLDGSFTGDIPLKLGENTISVHVVDLAGGLTAPHPVPAAAGSSGSPSGREVLTELNIIGGTPGGTELRLDVPLTRAELIGILVRAMGNPDPSQLLDGAAAFSDTADHWASGEIALAKNMGLTAGYPDATFAPDTGVTSAEAVDLLNKILGVDLLPGPLSEAPIEKALEAGVIGADSPLAVDPGKVVLKGEFYDAFGDAALNFPLEDGKTLLQTYIKPDPPSLVIDPPAPVTPEPTTPISGSVSPDTVTVKVGGKNVEILDGSFTADIELAVGPNEILVQAIDLVGNAAPQTVTITRTVGAAASIEVQGPTVVLTGQTVEFGVVVKDSNGVVISGACVTGTIDDPIAGVVEGNTLHAGTTPGVKTIRWHSGGVTVVTEVEIIKPCGIEIDLGEIGGCSIQELETRFSDQVSASGAEAQRNAEHLKGLIDFFNQPPGVSVDLNQLNAHLDRLEKIRLGAR
ncbi:MAG: S-layer homology domain-containing protein [Firmicutes bacterium]|nr:S-layer homology domain-containing protein [Bacillota bacterium]